MAQNKFQGSGVAIITPFRDDKSIDFKALGRLIQYQIVNKTNYLVILGTTGESVTLTKDEKRAIIDFAIEEVEGKIPIVVGIGGNNTQDILGTIRDNQFDNIDAILSVSPYYNKPTQNGIFEHYKAIAEASPVPVILYNVPGRTGSNIEPETTLKLARELSNIIAIKEASGNLEQIMKIIKYKPDNFLVISGDDLITLPMMSFGGSGVISVAANAYPFEMSRLVKSALSGNFAEASKIHYNLIELFSNLFIEGNPAGIKAILHIKKIISNSLRLPLTPVSSQTYKLYEKLNNKLEESLKPEQLSKR